MDNNEVQARFSQAIEILSESNRETQFEVNLVKSLLEYMKAYSASRNAIPGLRGLGLKEALMVADEIIASNNTRNIHIDTKLLASAVSLKVQ